MPFLTEAFSFFFFPMLEMIKKEKPTPWRMVSVSGPLNYNKYLKGDVSLPLYYCPLDVLMGKKKKKRVIHTHTHTYYIFNMQFGGPFSLPFFLSLPPGDLCSLSFYFKKSTFKYFFSPDLCSSIHMPLPGSHWLYPGAFILYIKIKVLKLKSQYQSIGPTFPSKYIVSFSHPFLGILFLNFACVRFAPRQYSLVRGTITSDPPSLWARIQINVKALILQLNRSAFPIYFHKTTVVRFLAPGSGSCKY